MLKFCTLCPDEVWSIQLKLWQDFLISKLHGISNLSFPFMQEPTEKQALHVYCPMNTHEVDLHTWLLHRYITDYVWISDFTTTTSFSAYSSPSANHSPELSAIRQWFPNSISATAVVVRLACSCEVRAESRLGSCEREVSGAPLKWGQNWVGLLMRHSWKMDG